MEKIKFWLEIEKLTKQRINDLPVDIARAQTGSHVRWLQATLETNYRLNLLANSLLESISEQAKRDEETANFKKMQFRANDDD
jgi:hypothetical protein